MEGDGRMPYPSYPEGPAWDQAAPPERRSQPFAEDDRSLGQLFNELVGEARTLVRQEIALAKVEVQEKTSRAGRHVGYVVGGGLVAYAGLFAVLAGVILLLARVMPDWLAALLVGAAVLFTGYALLQKGLGGLKKMDFSLDRTAETLREDKQWLKDEVT